MIEKLSTILAKVQNLPSSESQPRLFDECDQVYEDKVVRATKLDVVRSVATSPGPVASTAMGLGGMAQREIVGVTSPAGFICFWGRQNTPSIRLPRYSSVILKHSPLCLMRHQGELLITPPSFRFT